MEQFIARVRAYAIAYGVKPEVFLRRAANRGWGDWQRWLDGKSSPTLHTVDRIHAYAAANPPPEQTPNQEIPHDQSSTDSASDAA